MEDKVCLADQSFCIMCVYLTVADCVCAGAGWWSQETEAGHQAGAGGGLDDSGELRTALPRAHWEETPSETELCLSEDLSPSPPAHRDFLLPPFRDDFFLGLFSASSCPKIFLVPHPHCCINWRKNKKNLKGGSWLRSASSTLQCGGGGVPHLYHRERLRGECLKGGHIGKL